MASFAATAATLLISEKPALAFGSGFPGYDVNLDVQRKVLQNNKDQMRKDMEGGVERLAARGGNSTDPAELRIQQMAAAKRQAKLDKAAAKASAEAEAAASQ
eukprot:CAMPEP_0196578910 /NCGR_PEP_ID=MMETSP1081-20130531/12576_1 /TAXON_ID=36882 /ORGANISM="Pyramimonas amylifera, Strain CCMP720" /LENGTH=101 /DNA_ID=CAMNT_0041898299 /DNA_START=214 /DNA_END=519 /DNA_ORIENTATION=+